MQNDVCSIAGVTFFECKSRIGGWLDLQPPVGRLALLSGKPYPSQEKKIANAQSQIKQERRFPWPENFPQFNAMSLHRLPSLYLQEALPADEGAVLHLLSQFHLPPSVFLS